MKHTARLRIESVGIEQKPTCLSGNPRNYFLIPGVSSLTTKGGIILEGIASHASKRHACGVNSCQFTQNNSPATFYVSYGFDPDAISTTERLQRYSQQVLSAFNHWVMALQPKDYRQYFQL